MSEYGLSYRSDIEKSILAFLKKKMNFDVMGGDRELNLDLKVHECEMIFSANDRIKSMAKSGELKAFHDRCSQLDDAVSGGYLKVID